MTPEFAEAVDPIFMRVLGLLERIDRGENPSAENERLHIRGFLDQAEARLGQREDWRLAKYALISWVDEVLIDAPWNNRGWWENNSLEFELCTTRQRANEFYLKAKEASTLTCKDALEVFYVSVVLGFRGVYRNPEDASTLSDLFQLPPDLESWAKQTSLSIQLGQGRPPISEESISIEGAPPLEGPFLLIWAIMAGIGLSVFIVLFVWFFLMPGGS